MFCRSESQSFEEDDYRRTGQEDDYSSGYSRGRRESQGRSRDPCIGKVALGQSNDHGGTEEEIST